MILISTGDHNGKTGIADTTEIFTLTPSYTLGKMNALTNIFANNTNYFTADQARQLIHQVSDEDNRLQLAKSAYRNIIDRANYTVLNDLFNSQARKDALAAYVNSYRDSAGF